MRVLGVVCSPRKGGNTEIMVGEALASAGEAGAEVEMFTVAGKNLLPCDGCESCRATGECKINDDMQPLYLKLLEADGIIFGSPVYCWNVTAQAKIIIDRTYVLRHEKRLRNKVAGAIIVAQRVGASEAFSTFGNYFSISRMMSAASAIAYDRGQPIGPDERAGGAIGFGRAKGEVRQDKLGMSEARNLGKNLVLTIKKVQGAGLA